MTTPECGVSSSGAAPRLKLRGVKLLHRELQDVLAKPIPGIQVEPNESDIFTLSATIEGPESSPYQEGRFHVKLVFTDDYPDAPPKGRFITTIYHPNVSPTTGDICVSTLQKDWRPDLGIAHLLLTIKSLLMTPNPESALNEAAGKFILEDYEAFCQHAALMTRIHAQSPGEGRRTKDYHPSRGDDQNSAPPNQSTGSASFDSATTTATTTTSSLERKKPASSVPSTLFSETRRKLRRL